MSIFVSLLGFKLFMLSVLQLGLQIYTAKTKVMGFTNSNIVIKLGNKNLAVVKFLISREKNDM